MPVLLCLIANYPDWPNEGDLRAPVQIADNTTSHICHSRQLAYLTKDIHHMERIVRTETRFVNSLRGLTYMERFRALVLPTFKTWG